VDRTVGQQKAVRRSDPYCENRSGPRGVKSLLFRGGRGEPLDGDARVRAKGDALALTRGNRPILAPRK